MRQLWNQNYIGHRPGSIGYTQRPERSIHMFGILDPTISTPLEQIDYVPRPKSLKGLRIGLIENTKKNAEAVLQRVAQKLADDHGMTVEVLVHKPQRAPLKDEQVAQLKGRTDFAIAGVGD